MDCVNLRLFIEPLGMSIRPSGKHVVNLFPQNKVLEGSLFVFSAAVHARFDLGLYLCFGQ